MKTMKLKHVLFLAALLGSFGLSWPFEYLSSTPNMAQFGTNSWINREVSIISPQAGDLNENVLKLSLIAYVNAKRRGFDHKQLLTVIDYSKPSTEKRLWVFDLRRNRELFNTWVAHGKNSGDINADSFSNSAGSLKSSIGVYVTAEPYIGGDGYSLRLVGLDRGFNDNALNRNIVMHGAWYVNPGTINRYGEIGRSWGCPAVGTQVARPIIDTIKDNTVIFAYYPDRHWLSRSTFLNA